MCMGVHTRGGVARGGAGAGRYRYAVPLGPSQVKTCGVVSRPCPGRGSRLSLGESPDAKSRRGFPPAPPRIKPLAGARSIFWVGCLWSGLFLAKVHQTRFGNAYSEKQFLTGYCSVGKSSLKKSQKRKSPNQGTYMGCNQTHCRPAASLSPKQSERAASGLKKSGCRAEPCDSFPLLSYKESRAPAG